MNDLFRALKLLAEAPHPTEELVTGIMAAALNNFRLLSRKDDNPTSAEEDQRQIAKATELVMALQAYVDKVKPRGIDPEQHSFTFGPSVVAWPKQDRIVAILMGRSASDAILGDQFRRIMLNFRAKKTNPDELLPVRTLKWLQGLADPKFEKIAPRFITENGRMNGENACRRAHESFRYLFEQCECYLMEEWYKAEEWFAEYCGANTRQHMLYFFASSLVGYLTSPPSADVEILSERLAYNKLKEIYDCFGVGRLKGQIKKYGYTTIYQYEKIGSEEQKPSASAQENTSPKLNRYAYMFDPYEKHIHLKFISNFLWFKPIRKAIAKKIRL